MKSLLDLLPHCLRQHERRLEHQLQQLRGSGLPAPVAAARLERLLQQAQRSAAARQWRQDHRPRLSYPPELPITARKDDILHALRSHQVVIVAGETGSGKTTQLPKMCLEAGLGVAGRIGCTQPRRVAALSISRRLAQELNVPWGREVGCKIRFADRSHAHSLIKLMTDGILLAETQGDRLLDEYEVLIIDEAHERSLNIDFLLGYLKTLLPHRPELKLIITSATIDTEAFSAAFNQAPILEVSGRLYPVEIRYAPHDPAAEESGDLTYIDAAVSAVDAILDESARGDILVFMPGERDIRETADDLQGRHGGQAHILPLFGRLSAGEQERVFAPGPRRKIIVATNIAETSLTIPGIRYVVDTGLARVSRYSPRTRTRRLPIEPVAQSSANQRAGRSGRVEKGVCIRLYAEEDFAARPRFTQPEIQRANLAEVILRMKAFRLGEIETFPFLNPPAPQAIRGGYQLLQELGALDNQGHLTVLGRDLARLPVDPAIGRMVLQSIRENALEELLVIAAGLSIQDPRERPLDRQSEADQAHRPFLDPQSDFLSLLRIWSAYHETWETLRTQNQLRKFCQAHFLSYLRMREWRDIHAQLRESVWEVFGPQLSPLSLPPSREDQPAATARLSGRVSSSPPPAPHKPDLYAAIHRSILSGLLGHIAQRQARNLYRASGNREIMVFPGSSLFDRSEDQQRTGAGSSLAEGRVAARSPSQPEWIVAGEMLETSRLFARTVARLEPAWVVDLGGHLCRRTCSEPRWDRQAGRVLARERVTLHGLLLQENQVDYGRVNPCEATEIFIRSALVEEDLGVPLRFLEHNRQLRQKVEAWRTHSRDHRFPDPDEALFRFYARHLQSQHVSSVHDLNRILRERVASTPDFLCAQEGDLTGGRECPWDSAAFPATAILAGQSVRLTYAYAPGEEQDGVTVEIPVPLAPHVQASMLDWMVPGLREEQIALLFKALPKALRVALMPTAPKVKELAARLQPDHGLEGLRRCILEHYGVCLPAAALSRDILPPHLRPRIAITGPQQQIVAASRDLDQLKRGLEQHETPAEQKAWAAAVAQWERYDVRGWTFEDPPEQIVVTTVAGTPLLAIPGLAQEDNAVHLRLFRSREEAEVRTRNGWVRLAELVLQKELAWLQKDLKALHAVKDLYLSRGPAEELGLTAYLNLRRHLLAVPDPVLPLRREAFDQAINGARTALPQLLPSFVAQVRSILELRQQILGCPNPCPSMAEDLEDLLPARFLERIPLERLSHLPRYLKALLIRAERATLSPAKDAEKARRVHPYQEALRKWRAARLDTAAARQAVEDVRWMLEEFKVSVFAQELGTAQPVSPKRLDAAFAQLKRETGL